MTNSGEPQPAGKVIFGKYELLRLLGRGSSAKVYHARHLPSGLSLAIKVFPKPRPSSAAPAGAPVAVIREISALRRLRHRHILRLHEVLASRSRIYLVLELAEGGELFSRLAARGRLPEDHSRRLFRQLLSAVAYSHSRGVFHRDLKPENLLLDDAGDLKVSDFGLSSITDQTDGPDDDGRLLHTLCGTPAYVAPEIISKKRYDGAKVDIWSCGVVLFVLNAGYLPFNDCNLIAMYRKIHRGEFRCPRWTSPELRQLLAGLLDPEPETRITVEGVLRDPWFKMGGFDREKWTAAMSFRYDRDVEMEEFDSATSPSSKREMDYGRELNAFDIISFSSGLNLSGLFDPGSDLYRFVSAEPIEVLLDRVEELGRKDGLVVRRKRKKRFGVVVEGQNGNLVVRVDVFRLTGDAAVVEVEKGNGSGAAEMGTFWKNRLRAVLM